jgi:hypothetical protein
MRTGLGKESIGYDLALSRALTVMVVLCGKVITCFQVGGGGSVFRVYRVCLLG